MRTEPIFTKEALENLYDISQEILFKILELSTKYNIDFNIRVSSDGGLSVESIEHTQERQYLKSIAQSKGKITYIESTINK